VHYILGASESWTSKCLQCKTEHNQEHCPKCGLVKRMSVYLRNCLIKRREDDTVSLFEFTPEGRILVRLDGYAIVPKEEYEGLASLAHISGPVTASDG
jgi:hypothetical protein